MYKVGIINKNEWHLCSVWSSLHSLLVVASWGVSWCGQVPLVCCGHAGSIAMSVHLSASLWGQQASRWKELCETDRHQQRHLAHGSSISWKQMPGETNLKGKSSTFHVVVLSKLMVIVVNRSNKFLSLCYIDRESWVFWIVLLTQSFLQCPHVPGCIASQKNSTYRVSKVVIHPIRTFTLFDIA